MGLLWIQNINFKSSTKERVVYRVSTRQVPTTSGVLVSPWVEGKYDNEGPSTRVSVSSSTGQRSDTRS